MVTGTAGRGVRGGLVTVFGQAIKLCVQMISVIVLSRLLEPEDFGLIAMTAAFVAFGSLLRDFGMPDAALQARFLSHQQASNLFWLNSVLGLLSAVGLILLTPLIVMFYDENRLRDILPVMALSVVLGGISAQFQVHLARQHRFTALTLADVSAQVIGLVVALITAFLGAGYWALVGQILATAASLLLIQLFASSWCPSRPRRGADTRIIIKSGVNFGAAQLLNHASLQADTLAIGARWGALDVGVYNRAFQLLTLPISAMLSPLTRVVIPTINNARENGASVDSLLLRVQFLVGGATVWIFLIAATSAKYSVPILLGPGWEASVALFQILAIGGAVQAFSHVSYWGFMLYGRSDHLLRYNLVTKSLTILAIIGASTLSLEAVAWAYSICLILSWPINLIWLRVTANQDSWAYLKNGIRILLPAGCSAMLTFLLIPQFFSDLIPIGAAIGTAAISTFLFISILLLIPGGGREVRSALGVFLALVKKS